MVSSREALQSRLDALILDNRVTIAVIFPLMGAILLISSAEGALPGWLVFNAWLILIGVLVMRSPVLVGILPAIRTRAALGLGLLCAYAYLIEAIGVRTGWPYGPFEYGAALGPMVAGIPLALPLLFVPLALNAYLLWMRWLSVNEQQWQIVLLAIPTLVAMDLILDPGAVALGFWSFQGDTPIYGVPVSNYVGWGLSATVAVALIHVSFDYQMIQERLCSCSFMLDDLVSFLILWGLINIWYAQWGAVIVAIGLSAILLGSGHFDLRRRHLLDRTAESP